MVLREAKRSPTDYRAPSALAPIDVAWKLLGTFLIEWIFKLPNSI